MGEKQAVERGVERAVVPVGSTGDPIAQDSLDTHALLEAFFAGRSPRTITAYRRDLEDYRRFTDSSTVSAALRRLLRGGPGSANYQAHLYRAHLLERGLAPATINRRLAALRSVVKMARSVGLITWALDVENVRSEPYRDTRGPGTDAVRAMLSALSGRSDAKSLRDRAIVRLLYDLGLRRGEVVSLDLEDIDHEAGTLRVQGKGKSEKSALTLPSETAAALEAWIGARGSEPGPLFLSLDRAHPGRRLSGRSVARVVKALGEEAGVGEVRPHGFRHTAITEALDVTAGDVRAVQRFSRHSDVRVLGVYDDNREDLAGKIAELLASDV